VTVRFLRDGDEATVAARVVVGCDGAHSTVREVLGATFDGVTEELRAALADVALDRDGDLRWPRMTTARRLTVGRRMRPGLWRLAMLDGTRRRGGPRGRRPRRKRPDAGLLPFPVPTFVAAPRARRTLSP